MVERTNQFKMLLSVAELERLRKRAEEVGLTASDYLRTRIGVADPDLRLHRASVLSRSQMLREDIECLRTAGAADHDRIAINARSALAQMLWHVDRLLQSCGLDPLPQDDSPERSLPSRGKERTRVTRPKRR